MDSLILLVPVALALGLLGLGGFLWALRTGQYEDLDGAGARILFDDTKTERHPTP
ncbi:cbb3-type cytochrome oxidase assembly protein CcoS [Belnapia rosea]|uniref:Cytochrome oxidase maturation protein, cbb3-type n=1 Tax=Belnapia rosea TaxID=938405 RepID=A0A1G6R1D7_9PROT|nr:cbb3-type cytochrome oxidase assembly protein CcoS [Belnapia rosea]SDB73205.1 cytochrome oxidase maturation protein, cbb3-type [Belnapia rosea]SDC97845.1 cytochrome oxidase maturation protein, cbb3-type [Belnapia rosea]